MFFWTNLGLVQKLTFLERTNSRISPFLFFPKKHLFFWTKTFVFLNQQKFLDQTEVGSFRSFSKKHLFFWTNKGFWTKRKFLNRSKILEFWTNLGFGPKTFVFGKKRNGKKSNGPIGNFGTERKATEINQVNTVLFTWFISFRDFLLLLAIKHNY